jgi:glycosyltransferase involved in cell wall biosynthesis
VAGAGEIQPWLLVPIYDHGSTIEEVVEGLARYDLPCLIVDDGSAAPTRAVLAALVGRYDWLRVERVERNAGKGAALRRGFRLAHAAGATHVIHLDADGQHDTADVARFLDLIREDPEALVLGKPIFDDTVPRLRLYSRQLSRAVIWLCTLSLAIDDPLCGFRAIPLEPTLRAIDRERLGDHMEFEPGLTVVLYWDGVRVRNLPTAVRYVRGGVSHFDAVRDTLRMARLYFSLLLRAIVRIPLLLKKHRGVKKGMSGEE